jgi:hypothetical protein
MDNIFTQALLWIIAAALIVFGVFGIYRLSYLGLLGQRVDATISKITTGGYRDSYVGSGYSDSDTARAQECFGARRRRGCEVGIWVDFSIDGRAYTDVLVFPKMFDQYVTHRKGDALPVIVDKHDVVPGQHFLMASIVTVSSWRDWFDYAIPYVAALALGLGLTLVALIKKFEHRHGA